MSFDSVCTLGILAVSVLLFLSEKLRPDLIAILTAALLAGFGIITAKESFSGFSSSAVMVIISVFILAEGITRTGLSELFARYLLRWGGKREGPLVALFMGAGGALSLFVNNIAAAAVLIPSAGTASERSDLSVSRLLIPLAFATIMGGMATLLTTMNIVVGTVLEEHGLPGFSLLDFLPLGLPVLAAGIVYMVLWGRFRLPAGSGASRNRCPGGTGRLFGLYGMSDLFFRARVPRGSFLAGRKIKDSVLREEFGLSIVAVSRHGTKLPYPSADTVLREGDVLTLKGSASEFAELDREPRLEILDDRCMTVSDVESPGGMLAEVMLTPRSSLIGSTLRESMFRKRYEMNVVAVWREGEPIRRDIRSMKLRFGDALLGIMPEDKFALLHSDPDLIPLTSTEVTGTVRKKAPAALLIILATLLTVVLTPLPISQVFFSGAVLMLLTGIVNMQQAYRAIDWRVVFLVAGMLPVALAMQKSGVADMISTALLSGFGHSAPLMLVSVLFFSSAILAQAVSGAAVAAVMAPIAAAAALSSSIPAHALGMAVALGSSMAFLTPLGHPVNLMVMGAGGYRFRDYRRVGGPLFMILSVVIILTFTLRWNLLGI